MAGGYSRRRHQLEGKSSVENDKGNGLGEAQEKPCQLAAPLPTQSFPACPTGQNLSMNSPRLGEGWGGATHERAPHTSSPGWR